jgi:hypothetical protein
MKVRVDVYLYGDQERELRARFADLIDPHGVGIISCAEEHPRLKELVEQMHSIGWVHAADAPRGQGRYQILRRREYDDADLDGHELLQLATTHPPIFCFVHVPQEQWESLSLVPPCPDYGVIGVQSRGLPPAGVLTSHGVGYVGIFVHEQTRLALVEGGFSHLRFLPFPLAREVEIGGRYLAEIKPYPKNRGPWWMMDSTVRMPIPSDTLLETTRQPGVYQAPSEKCMPLIEKGWGDVELHYRRSDLAPLPPFEVARARSCNELARIIVNQRFRQFCRERGLQFTFRPVRIEER